MRFLFLYSANSISFYGLAEAKGRKSVFFELFRSLPGLGSGSRPLCHHAIATRDVLGVKWVDIAFPCVLKVLEDVPFDVLLMFFLEPSSKLRLKIPKRSRRRPRLLPEVFVQPAHGRF